MQDFSSAQDSKFKDEIQHKKNLLQRIKSGQKGLTAFEQDLQNRHKRNAQTIEYSNENSKMVSNCASNSNFNISSPGGAKAQLLSFQSKKQEISRDPMLAFASKDAAAQSFSQPNDPRVLNQNPTLKRATNSQQALLSTQFDQNFQVESCRDQVSGDIQSQQIGGGYIGINQLNTICEDGKQVVADNFNQYLQRQSQGGNSEILPQVASEVGQTDKRSAVATEEEDRIQKRTFSKEVDNQFQNQNIGVRSSMCSSARGSNINVQASLSPPRQNFIVNRESTLGSSNGREKYARYRQDSLERQAAQSYPLRKPTASPSINLSQNSKSPTLTGRQGYEITNSQSNDPRALRKESIRQSRGSSMSNSPNSQIGSYKKTGSHQISASYPSRQQLVDKSATQNLQWKHPSPIYPIAEQDTTQEISSIDPHGVSAQQKDISAPCFQNGQDLALNNDDTQYVFTSAQHSQSIVDPSQKPDENFQFNTRALAESPMRIDKSDPYNNDNQYRLQLNAGELSEPYLATGKPFERPQIENQAENFRQQIQSLARHEDYSGLPAEAQQKHHAGGSFGNLKDFGHQYVIGNNSQNTLASIQKMLDPRSRKVDGDFSTAQTQGFGPQPQGDQDYFLGQKRKDSEKQRGKVRIVLSDDKEVKDGFDSSLEFKTRKYNILKNLTTEHMRKKSRDQKGRRQSSKHHQNSSEESEPVNQKAPNRQSKRGSASGSKKRRIYSSKYKKQRREKYYSQSESESDLDNNDSQISLSQKSRESYGKYFMRSRSNVERNQRSYRGVHSKKSRKAGDRSARSAHSTSNKKQRLSREKRSKSVVDRRKRKSKSKSIDQRRNALNGSAEARRSSKKSRNSSRSHARDTFGGIAPRTGTGVNQSYAVRPPISGFQRKQMNTLQHNNLMNTIDSIAKRRNSACRTIQAGVSSLPRAKRIPGRKTLRSQGSSKNTTEILLDSRSGETLAQRLLIDLAKKYRSMGEKQAKALHGHISGHPVAAKAQQLQIQQMIQEIQSLAIALIKSEKRMAKTKAAKSNAVKQLKSIIDDQENCIALLQEKAAKLDSKNSKLQRNEVQLSQDLQREEQKIGFELAEKDESIRELEKRVQEGKSRGDTEKREIIIAMEKELQTQVQRLQKESDIKINSLKSINDQLNVRLQDLQEIERAHKKISFEYNQSLQLLNEFQEQVGILDQSKKELEGQCQTMEVELESLKIISQKSQDEYLKKVEQLQSRHEQQVSSIQKMHHYELQKLQITQGANEDSEKFLFEEKITDLQMQLQKKDLVFEEAQRQISAAKDLISNQNTVHNKNEEKLSTRLKESEEQRSRIELEAKNLENQVDHLQRIIQQKDEQLTQASKQQPDTSNSSQNNIENKNNLQVKIHQLEQQVGKYQQKVESMKEQLSQTQIQKQRLQEDAQKQVESLKSKVDLQQQEIQILAQGFQAQQVCQENQNHFMAFENRCQNNIRIDEAHQSSLKSGYSDQGLNSDIKEVAGTQRDKSSSHAMNIQSNYTPRENHTTRSSKTPQLPSQASNSSQEKSNYRAFTPDGNVPQMTGNEYANLYFQKNEYLENKNQILAQSKLLNYEMNTSQERQSQESSKFINTCSLSSTGQQLQYVQNKNMSQMMFQQQNTSQEFESKPDIDEESTPPTSSRDGGDEPDPPQKMYQDKLSQKDEEIKILWSVISQMRGGASSQKKGTGPMTEGSFGRKVAETKESDFQVQMNYRMPSEDKEFDGQLIGSGFGQTLSGGNQSSIMGILAPHQYITGETAASALINTDMTSGPNTGLLDKQTTELSVGHQHLSEPQLVDKHFGQENDVRQSRDSVRSATSKQELIDVKKRIQKLMGPKIDQQTEHEFMQKDMKYKTQHRPQGSYGESSARISKFASGVVSEGIEDYCDKNQV